MVDKINVYNKSAGMVVYKIPGSPVNGVRTFYAGQKQLVPTQELIELCQQPGGAELFYNYLYVNDPEVIAAALDMEPEREYWLTEDKLPGWMVSCSVDEFIDALNFAPEGTKDLIKSLAVKNKLSDTNKREAIKEILGYDVSAAIEASGTNEDAGEQPVAEKTRRVTSSTPARKATTSTIVVPAKTAKSE